MKMKSRYIYIYKERERERERRERERERNPPASYHAFDCTKGKTMRNVGKIKIGKGIERETGGIKREHNLRVVWGPKIRERERERERE